MSQITFTSMVTGDAVSFDAYVTDMGQSFSSTWNSVDVFGRNDPIATFQGTKRTISLGFEVPAANKAEAEKNLEKCAKLATFLYPGYKIDGQVKTLEGGSNKFVETGKAVSRAPLIKIKLANLIDTMAGSKPETKKEKVASAKSQGQGLNNLAGFDTSANILAGTVAGTVPAGFVLGPYGAVPITAATQQALASAPQEPKKGKEAKSKKKQKIEGLLGFIDSYNFTPSIDAGMFRGGANLYPRNITVTISFTVLHQVELGYAASSVGVDSDGNPTYGANTWMGGKLPFT